MRSQNLREHDRVEVEFDPVDDENPNKLTLSEIKELKLIARKSKSARELWTLLIGFAGAIGAVAAAITGLPAVIDYFRAHWR